MSIYAIEENVPIPAKFCLQGRNKSPLRQALCKMKVGQSMLVTEKFSSSILTFAAKDIGGKFISRRVDGGRRIWRSA